MRQPVFVPGHHAPESVSGDVACCVFQENRVFIARQAGRPVIPRWAAGSSGFDLDRAHYLGTLDGVHCYAIALQAALDVPGNLELLGLRALILEGDETAAAVAGQAFQVLEWARTHRYCGSCGGATRPHATDRAVECPECRLTFYPRVAPVVMALVYRDGEILLTRKPGYAPGRYTVIAGFVEAGESLEQCLAREISEEVGVTIANPCYFGSQPWPFPNSLVMAFSASWADGDVRADPAELEDARWFAIDALPELPEAVHISRQLIDDTLRRMQR